MEIDYNKIIDRVFFNKHQALGYFMIRYEIGCNACIYIYECDMNFEINRKEKICSFDYINDDIIYYRSISSELNSYLAYEIFYEITKEIQKLTK